MVTSKAPTTTRLPTIDASTLPANPSANWDRRLADLNGHLLQSWRWGEFKQQHGWSAHRLLVEDSAGTAMAQVLYRFKGPVSVGYIPRGPAIGGDPAVLWPLLCEQIDASGRRNRAILTIVEPNEPLGLVGAYRDAGMVKGPAHLQPGRTVKLPLADDDALLKQMEQKTRYSVRLAIRRNVTIERHATVDEAIDTFYDLMCETAQRNHFHIHSRDYYADFLRTFGDEAVLLFARLEGGALAAVLVAACCGREAIYMYGASSIEHRGDGAAFLLQYEAMKWGRDRGCETYDLWGIPERQPETDGSETGGKAAGTKGDDWRGLYRFKTGFGGEIVTYPDVLERRHVPVLPWLARKLNVFKG